MKIRSRQDWKLQKSDMEKTKGKSLTVPDDSYSIREILEKFTSGVDPRISRAATWADEEPDHDDEDLEELDREDYGDRMDRLQDLKDFQDELNRRTQLQKPTKPVESPAGDKKKAAKKAKNTDSETPTESE